MSRLVLAIDVGTQSTRAIAFDERGEAVGTGRASYAPYVAPRPGWAEQDAEVYWRAVGEACRALWAGGVDPRALEAVALTTQRGTVVPVDAAGVPVRPAIVWLDARRTEDLAPLGGLLGLAFRLVGASGTVERFRAEAELSWLRAHEPETLARTVRYLLLSGFLTHRLTGRFVDAAAAQIGYLPFDFRRGGWARPGDWKWRALPLDPALLPELVPPTGRLGTVTPAAAETTGLPVGLPLVAAAADRACDALGAGAIVPEIASVAYGTTATVVTTLQRYVEPERLVPAYPAAIPGAYGLETQLFRGYWLVEWFRRELGERETREAEALAVGSAGAGVAGAGVAGEVPSAEALLDRLLDATPPGADGLLHLPTWSPGVRTPGPEARGAWVGLTGSHGRAHLYRAMLEGLAFALRAGLERTERRTGVRTERLRLSGGGARSAAVARLTADIFGLPVELPHTHETASLGAAIDAAVGAGLHPDVTAATAAMTRVGARIEPDAGTHRRYEATYRRAYLPLEPALRPTLRAIRELRGEGG